MKTIDAEVSTELVRAEEAAISPMSILQMAVSQGANIDQLTKLMELQERFEANEARKAYSVAFSDFKAEAINIVKNMTVKDGPLKDKKYADLFGVVSAITPLMSKHGLSHSWKLSKDEPLWMEVTCTIRHILGHSESVSMGAAPDSGPGRNAIQARGSAKSYLERYTLLAATGTAASGVDNDGNTVAKEMDLAEFDRIKVLIETAPTIAILKDTYMSALKTATAAGDTAATRSFAAVKDARYKELNNANR
jgi:hypothetical protein